MLDRVLYTAPFVLINGDNTSPCRVDTLDEARAALQRGEAATVAGQLRPGVIAADIDPETDPVLGDAVAERLIAWCVEHDVPYCLRESGRAGGRHVLAVTHSDALSQSWNRLCRDLDHQYGVSTQPRTGMALRLLTAPHRAGLPAPVLGGTLTAAIAAELMTQTPGRHRGVRRQYRPATKHGPAERDQTRSAKEFGEACRMIRDGYTAARAWSEQARPGSKALERGQVDWRRFVWLPAIVTVAAEQGATEPEAWRRSQRECHSRCKELGLAGWRARLWRPACEDARRDRPRRRRPRTAIEHARQQSSRDTEIDVLRRGLLAAVDPLLTQRGDGPRRRRSAAAAVYALAPSLVHRDGSLDIRTWAEAARLDPKTVRTVRDILIEVQIITIAHRYAGGSQDCTRYSIGPAAQPFIAEAEQNSPTSCSTPAPPTGAAHLPRLQATHRADRRIWRLRCSLSTSTEGSESYAASRHAAARTLRSLWFQRKWWQSLSPDQQEQRRQARRLRLASLHKTTRYAWFDWLSRRTALTQIADRIHDAGQFTTNDMGALAAAPRTVHRGLRSPDWITPAKRAGEVDGQLIAA